MNGNKAPSRSNSSKPAGLRMMALEIEEEEEDEIDSLMMETTMDDNSQQSNSLMERQQLVKRHAAAAAANNNKNNQMNGGFSMVTQVQGILRSGIGYASSYRNFCLLFIMAIGTFFLLDVMNWDVHHINPADVEVRKRPHAPSLGGLQNPGHYDTPAGSVTTTTTATTEEDANDEYWGDEYNDDFWDAWIDEGETGAKTGDQSSSNNNNDVLPKTGSTGVAVMSLSKTNIDNANGHYLHDPLKSHFSSPLYKYENDDTAEKEQAEFVQKLAAYKQKYGQWQPPYLPDDVYSPEFGGLENVGNDMPSQEFPEYAWHLQKDYVTDFLQQAKALVTRVKEGIYEEYGLALSGATATTLDQTQQDAIMQKRDEYFGVQIKEYHTDITVDVTTGTALDVNTREPLPGIAYMNRAAWDGLVRKLLHAMITEDDFYAVVVGGAHTILGNNMFQTQIMQFQYLMEPVLHELGIKLYSRNMGMDISTTALNALGGADIYGEADILWYIQDERKNGQTIPLESDGQFDLLHIQSILSGQRMPIILTPNPGKMMEDTEMSQSVWMGNIQPGAKVCEPTTNVGGTVQLPDIKACQYVNCDESAREACDAARSSVCWVERTDWNPEYQQNENVGHQDEGFPNPNQHLLASRKLSMLILHALDEAIDTWETEHRVNEAMPLPDELWHVTETYNELREKVRTDKSTACDEYVKGLDTELCHMELHSLTEWTPRVMPLRKRLKQVVLGEVADIHGNLEELYAGINLLPTKWKLGPDELDVHMIAIAANTTEMENDMEAFDGDQLPLSIGGDEQFFEDDDFAWIDGDDGWGAGFENEEDDFLFDSGDNRKNRLRRRMQQSRRKARRVQPSVISKTLWTVFNAPIGYCDGSSQSRCNRVIGNKCLLSNHNNYKAGLMGHGNSGVLKLKIPGIKEGLILLRFDWNADEVRPMADFPDDFKFSYKLDEKTTTLSKQEFIDKGVTLAEDLIIHPVLIDKEMAKTESKTKTFDLEIQIQTSEGNEVNLLLSHIYFA